MTCAHSGSRLWISNWISWCGECGSYGMHPDELQRGRTHKKGDIVDQLSTTPHEAHMSDFMVKPARREPETVVYLAHGYRNQEIGRDVQTELEQYGITVINPFQRAEQALYDKYVEKGVEFPPEICEQIVRMDLEKIDHAHGVVAIPSTSSIGTFMEIFYAAFGQGKPVFTLWLHGGSKHPWLAFFTHLYMGDRKIFITAVKEWADGRRASA